MDIAMTLPTMLPQDRSHTLAWCRAIDEGPWSSLAVPERVTYGSHSYTVQISAAAALTERVQLWTTIIVLPAHDEVQVAKDMASVDRLSDGRLTVGVGVGGREHDYRAVGASFANRWARMDSQVKRMRSIWAGEPPFDGADPVGPPPVTPGGPPLVAGCSGPKALARAAQWAAGVDDPSTIMSVHPERTAAAFERIRAAWNEAGNATRPHISASVWFALGDDASEQLSRYVFDYLKVFGEQFATGAARHANVSSASVLRASLEVMAAAGCDEVFLVPTTTDVSELDRAREALGI